MQQIDPRISVPFNIICGGPLTAGFFIVAFQLIKKQPTQFGDYFKGFNYFVPLVLANILVSILIAIGSALLVLPGLYLAVAYVFTVPIILDRRVNFWQAMESGRKIVTKKWFSFFWFILVLVFINLLGVIMLGIGLLVTIPLSFCAIAVAYDDIIGIENKSF